MIKSAMITKKQQAKELLEDVRLELTSVENHTLCGLDEQDINTVLDYFNASYLYVLGAEEALDRLKKFIENM